MTARRSRTGGMFFQTQMCCPVIAREPVAAPTAEQLALWAEMKAKRDADLKAWHQAAQTN